VEPRANNTGPCGRSHGRQRREDSIHPAPVVYMMVPKVHALLSDDGMRLALVSAELIESNSSLLIASGCDLRIGTVVNKQSCLGIAWGLLGVTKQLNLICLLVVLVAT
jgi:hypothetical protein